RRDEKKYFPRQKSCQVFFNYFLAIGVSSYVKKMIGARLPDDYRAYLLNNNGQWPYLEGYEEKSVFVRLQWPEGEPAAEGGEITYLHDPQVLAEDRDEQETFDIRWEIENDEDSVPTDTLVIWRDPFSNFFLLGIRKHNYGKVYFQARAYLRFDANNNVTHDAIAFVANSFTEFIQMVESDPDDYEAWKAAGRPHLPLESNQSQ
ncbi:MAG: SMI1/KNR4 family protein, partial [Candidatus Thiodiazotropha sp. (ex Rostrolucina anterorostrata)]|nr:SMI1/KNR4 family protein [Candidatus Thiodiazotropha sp. (ex Rostrolucina anterorostrata)]